MKRLGQLRHYRVVLTCVALILFIYPSSLYSALDQEVGGSSVLKGKLLVGYQGWFRCPNDGSGDGRWAHWAVRGSPTAESLQVDLYPDLSEFNKRDLCEVPSLRVAGGPAYLYSAWNKNVVNRHFAWMKQYGIDGALAQRFIADLPRLRKEHDQVLQNIRSAAEKSGRIFAVEYDVSEANPATLEEDLLEDWNYLTNTLHLTDSPAYIKDKGKPLVSVWGLGFREGKHITDPNVAKSLISRLKNPGNAVIMGGVPQSWATLDGDSLQAPAWRLVYGSLDIVQPWTVGRFHDQSGVGRWATEKLVVDQSALHSTHQDYLPVIFPGFSWHNLNRTSRINIVSRDSGTFMWEQAYRAISAGASSLKIAMFDEVNEGTAIFKVASSRPQAPDQGDWVTLNMDGKDLPNDWYLRLSFEISKALHQGVALPSQIPPNPGPKN